MLYRSNRRKHRTVLAASFILSVIAASSEASAQANGHNGEIGSTSSAAPDRLFISEKPAVPELRAV